MFVALVLNSGFLQIQVVPLVVLMFMYDPVWPDCLALPAQDSGPQTEDRTSPHCGLSSCALNGRLGNALDGMFPPTNSYVEALIPHLMIFGGGAFAR